jgi:ABC-type uncharacterized transport system involved in gliding motility auxiliary subunit
MIWDRNEWARWLAAVGGACLVAGYLRYSIEAELRTVSKVLLIAGGVVLLAAVVIGFRQIVGFFSKRSSQLGTNTVILTVAVIAILVVLNVLSFRHAKRFDLTSEKLFSLSDQTHKVVGSLKQDVTIARFGRSPLAPEDSHFVDLMTEYKHLSPHFQFLDVNPQEKPEVAKEFGAKHLGDVIVAAGPNKVTLDPGPDGSISESDITNTILKVTRDTVKTVCFVTGHGEKSPADGGMDGYAQIAENLKKETYATNSINLVSGGGVPPDCAVLIIAGPTKPFFPQETGMVAKYLDAGGKVLIEVDPETDPKLDSIFQAWNINLGNNVVIDASGMGQLLGTGPEIPLVVEYGDSPITKSLQKQMTYFPVARTVSIADKSKPDPSAVELLKTSSRSFTKAKLEHTVKYDPKTDTLGPLSLGVAASKKVGDQSARLVVIGDSDFATNQVLGGPGSDGDLFLDSVNWLAQDENLISIRPKPETSRHITLTLAQTTALAWIDRIFLPGIVILFGIATWWKRR